MDIPKILKIGPHSICVSVKEGLTVDRDHCGEYSPRELAITLDASLAKRHDEILLHEIIEAVCDIYDLDIDHHHLTVLSSALCQVLKDNKIVF
ncbi:MAG: hypothetical protein HQP61_02200 [Peptococcaceae bacterium]|nr:hypothetical protein [Candidatus Syntrophopropionicum ammoniitolerans]